MGIKRRKPEEFASKLRRVEVIQGQGMKIAEAARRIGVTQQICCQWRKLSVAQTVWRHWTRSTETAQEAGEREPAFEAGSA